MSRTKAVIGYAAAIALLAGGLTAFASSGPTVLTPSPAAGSSPSTAGPLVCGNASILTGPATPPAGAVTVAAGDNSAIFSSTSPANTVYWFAPGTHTLGGGEYGQINPGNNDTFVGGPGAILNGQGVNDSAFDDTSSGVTIEYLTIEGFIAPQSEGVVNHDSGTGWTIENDTVQNNPEGAGVMLGTNNVLTNDCLTKNGQYGFQGYSSAGPSNIKVTNNEISFNDTANYDANNSGCGCTGGAKFWDVNGATVTGNYVHDNESVGLWADTNDVGFDFSGNYFSHNFAEAIVYEISYNFSITNNTFVDNAWGSGPTNPGFPDSAIYISESGSDSRISSPYNVTSVISGNVFTDNWGGVVLWENSNRYCGSAANSSTGYCTLVNPSVYTTSSCAAKVPSSTPSGNPDYYDNCRWKTQNVSVTNNTFNFTPSNIGSSCTVANTCGFNGVFSEAGSYPPYTGWVVPLNISDNQNNHFANNTYAGPWNFDGFDQGDTVSWSQWSSGFEDQNGSNDTFNAQDAGSTFNGSAVSPTTTTTTTHPTTTTTVAPTTTTTTHPTTTTTTTSSTTTTTTTTSSTTTTTTTPTSAVSVTHVAPNSGPTSGGTSVTITGTGFTGATGVHFGSTSATIGSVSASSIAATAPASVGGTVDVTVTTPAGTSHATSADQYTYIYPKPVVTSISPSVGAPGGGAAVAITGSGFTGATTISFGSSVASFTVNSNTSITATEPAGTAKSVVDVTVTGPGGTSALVASDKFTYGPVITSVAPNSGNHLGGTTVNIKGAGFAGATAVSFGGTAVTSTITVNAAGTQITVSAPAHAAGAVDITVTVGGVITNTSASDTFTYV